MFRKIIIACCLIGLSTTAVYAEKEITLRNLKMLGVIYRGAPGDRDRLDDEQVLCVKNGVELAREFYFRNTQCRLNLDIEYMIVDTSPPDHDGPTYDNIVKDLRSRGVKDNQYDGMFCTGIDFRGNYGGFLVFENTGAAFGGGAEPTPDFEWWPAFDKDTYYGTTWMITHEFQHALDLVICERAGHPEMLHDHPYADSSSSYFWWGHRGAQHFDWVAHCLSSFKDYMDVKGATDSTITTADADEDGLPDDDPRLPMDEKRFGSDPTKKDTDGDGIDDLQEFCADIFQGSDPTNSDTDGDGIPDGKDKNPTVTIAEKISYSDIDPAIDGKMDSCYKPFTTGMYVSNSSILGAARTSACWNEDSLYLFVNSEVKCSLEVWIDTTAENGYWEGGDTYVIRADHDGKVAITWPEPRDITAGMAAWGEDGLEVKIPALIGQGLSLEINFGGKRRPEDVVDGMKLLAGQKVSFNMRLVVGKFKALITPNHSMFDTVLDKSPSDPSRPSLRFSKKLTNSTMPVMMVTGVSQNDKVYIVDSSGQIVGQRIGSGEVTLTGEITVGLDPESGTNVLRAIVGAYNSPPFTLCVDIGALPPVVQIEDGRTFKITGEPGAQADVHFRMVHGGPSVPLQLMPLASITLDDNGYGEFSLPADGRGLIGAYGINKQFDEPLFWRIDPEIDFNYEDGSPDPRSHNENFCMRWTGYLDVPQTDYYKFFLASDDGSRLVVDKDVVIDNWGHHGIEEGQKSAEVRLAKGQHYMRLDYYEEDGWAGVHLEWSSSAITRTTKLPMRPLFNADPKDVEFHVRQTDTAGNVSTFIKCKVESDE